MTHGQGVVKRAGGPAPRLPDQRIHEIFRGELGEIVELLAAVHGLDELEKRHGFYLSFLY